LIQDRAPKRNIDSKARAAGFDYFKFQFHRLQLATFATKSARSGGKQYALECRLLGDDLTHYAKRRETGKE
jgi:hypothetical protein